MASESEDCVGFSCHGDEIATVFGSYGVPAVAEIGDCTPDKFDSLQPYVGAVQKQWGHFIREGTPNTAATAWAVVSDKTGPVFRFEQVYTEEGGRVPALGESDFTTHHTEQESYTAQEVCKTWSEHTWKTESSASKKRFFGKLGIVIHAVVPVLVIM